MLSGHFERVMKMNLFMAVDELMATAAHYDRDSHVELIAELCDPVIVSQPE